MTAVERKAASSSAFLWLVIAAIALVAFIGLGGNRTVPLPGIGDVKTGTHAEERHGSDAALALQWAARCGRDCLYRCEGDKWYYIGQGENGLFFVVVGYADRLATAFLVKERPYSRLVRDHCQSEYQRNAGHDWMVGAY